MLLPAAGASALPALEGIAAPLYVAVSVLCVAAVALGAWHASQGRRPWQVMTLGQATFATGDALSLLGGHRNGLWSLDAASEALWLIAPALLVASLLAMLRAQGPGLDRLAVVDVAVTAVSVATLMWVWVTAPAVRSEHLGLGPAVLAEGHMTLAVLVTVVAVVLAVSGPARGTAAARLLAVSAAANLVGIAVWSTVLLSVDQPGPLLWLGWLVAYVAAGAAAVSPSRSSLTARRDHRQDPDRPPRSLTALAVPVPLGLLLAVARQDDVAVRLLACAACVVFVLVLVRLVLTERVLRRAAAALALDRADQRFRALVQAASDLILIVGTDGRVRYATPSACRRLGQTLVGDPLTAVMSSADARALRAPAGRGDAGHECVLTTADGAEVPVEVLRAVLPDDHGLVLTMRDVGERRSLEEQLRRMAYTDPLTGIANRARLRERLAEVLAGDVRGALLLIDLDDFKVVNDLYGHPEGDALLVETAARLELSVADLVDALAVRLGGDEFALLLPDVDADAARAVCGGLVGRLRQPVVAGGARVEVGATIGLVLLGPDRDDADEALRDADLALYAAKADGRGRWAEFEPYMHQDLLARLTLEGELRRAVEQREFVPHYQPVVDLQTGALVGVEALVRWQSPQRGLVGPGTFISAVERTPLIHALGALVLRAAAEQLVVWSEQFGPSAPREVAVNVSPRQLLDPGFPALVADVLAETGLAPSRLVLEITETALIDAEASTQAVHRLRDLGVALSIDDFGTGYSSLARLGRLPVTSLKIDRSFVNDLCAGAAPLVRAIVSMAHSLGLSLVAEGVETQEQRDALALLGCEQAQGFLFARPLPAADLAALLALGAPLAPRRPDLPALPRQAGPSARAALAQA